MSEGGEKLSLYQTFFELQLTLCERFPALTPFEIRKQRAYEVFLLVRRLNTQPKKEQPKNATPGTTVKNGEIRRPASDDWY